MVPPPRRIFANAAAKEKYETARRNSVIWRVVRDETGRTLDEHSQRSKMYKTCAITALRTFRESITRMTPPHHPPPSNVCYIF